MTRIHALLAGISLIAMGQTAARAKDAAAALPASDVTSADAGAGSTTDADQSSLSDIVVTGEKHETTLQSAPLAITAISGDQLAQRNLNQVTDLNGFVPGLNVSKSEGAERIITIRGIGYETAQNPNSQPGVAFHIDGVYIANVLALNQDLLDVDRIEVLRGPQGTVFGETSTGGAINVITKKPVLDEASGSLAVSGGNHAFFKGMGTVNIPISPTLAFRGSAQFLEHSPYGYATATPSRARYGLDDAFNLGVRGSLLWQPNDRFTAILSGQYFDQNRAASLQKDITDTDPRARYVTQDFAGKFRIHTEMGYLTLTELIGDHAELKSVTAYQLLDKHQTSDNDRLANPAYFDNIVLWQDKSKTFTQELSLASVGENRLDYTVGGFFLRQRALQNILEDYTFGLKFQTDSPYQHTTLAGFGNLTLHATDQFALIAGARYNYDKITAQPFQYYTVIPPKTASSRAVTGKVGAEFHMTPLNMVYVTGSRGYKPTGLNFNTPGIFVGDSFKKETVNAAEIGTKNEFFDRKVRLNVAAYYYWYNNLQFTAEDPVPFSGGTANIPHARIYGAEVEFAVLPFEGFRIDGTGSYGHGKLRGNYTAIDAQSAALIRQAGAVAIGCAATNVGCYFAPSVIAAVAGGAQDTDGNPVPKLPRWQAQVSPSYTFPMLGGKLTLRGDVIYRGGFNYRLFAVAALDRVPAYTVFNAYIGYVPDDRPWTISVSGQNVTDKAGINSRFSDPYGSGTTSVEYIDPRQIFATFGFKW